MIRCVEALGYRALRRDLADFQILVGPNASGKSTFLDVVRFLGDVLKDGIEGAVRHRSPNLQNLIWMQENRVLELAVEIEIPDDRREKLPQEGYERARYEVALGASESGELALHAETLWLRPGEKSSVVQRDLFPTSTSAPRTILIAPEGRRSPLAGRKWLPNVPNLELTIFYRRRQAGTIPFVSGLIELHLPIFLKMKTDFP